MAETIFALSSGAPPAAIGVIRISGPDSGKLLQSLAGRLPEPRKASLAKLRANSGEILDSALVLWFPGPATATGEDLAELHCHGGRAVIASIEAELGRIDGVRRAEPGEFTRRAFANGRIDLAEAEGLADLLSAETELQRRAAMAIASGKLSQSVDEWRDRVLVLSAEVEAALDFSDEDDVAEMPADFVPRVTSLAQSLQEWLARPRAERLSEGYRVVLAGPPNAGKSTLFNALLESEAAITSPQAGTTRDVIERSVAIGGVPFTFVDTAGLHEGSGDEIERIGIERARGQLDLADRVLWLGPEGDGPSEAWEVDARIDEKGHVAKAKADVSLSAKTGESVDALKMKLVDDARLAMPKPGEVALNARQHRLISDAHRALVAVAGQRDPLLIAEQLRFARASFDAVVGRSTVETMLDALFGRFCIGK